MAVLRQAAPTGERFHVVLSDCQMPDVDGFALARQIKHDQGLRSTPVILLTSVGRSGDAERCRRLGVDAYLTKPVKHSDLLDTLATSCRRVDATGEGSAASAPVDADAAPAAPYPRRRRQSREPQARHDAPAQARAYA